MRTSRVVWAVITVLLGVASLATHGCSNSVSPTEPSPPAPTWIVNADGSGDFPTIQAAIDAAEDGDVIGLGDGTFSGEGNRELDYIGRAVTIRSQSRDASSCIIDCEAAGRGLYIHSGEGRESVLQGVTVTNGLSSVGGGMWVHGASPSLIDCRFVSNTASQGGGGVYCSGGASPLFTGCAFKDNTYAASGTEATGGGVLCASSDVEFISCAFSGNAPGDGNGDKGGGVYLVSSSARLTDCVFSGNEASMYGGGLCCYTGASVVLTDCDFTSNSAGNSGGGLMCSGYAAPCTLSNCTFSANSAPYGAGMYGSSLTIRACEFRDNTGYGGAGATFGGAFRVSDCLFASNGASSRGGGLHAGSGYSSAEVVRCAFSGNTANEGGGVSCAFSHDLVFTDCVFEENSATSGGGALNCWNQAKPRLIDCVIHNNTAASCGGVYSWWDSGPSFERCTISCNTGAAIGGWGAASLELTNCTVCFNDYGVYCGSSSATITRSIIAHSREGEGFGSLSTAYPIIIECCNIYGNAGGDWTDDIADLLGISGNISEDPLFCGDAYPDQPYTLQTNSPCAPDNNPECDLIGAWDVGCEPEARQ